MTTAVLDRIDPAPIPRPELPPVGKLVGRAEPRLWTRPLRELTPETSKGFEAIAFAKLVLGVKLMPWQEWWLIHALELREDGTFRFRLIVTLISRQNGKTFLLKVLSLYFLYVLRVPLVLGTAQDLKIARESWEGAYDLAADVPDLAAEFVANPRGKPGRKDGSGFEEILLNDPDEQARGVTKHRRRYRVSASTKSAGRGLSVDLLILDELRHLIEEAWAALSKTTIARPNSITVGITNAGDDDSIVLNRLRAAALADADETLCIMEWSAEDGAATTDRHALAQANPALGHGTLTEAALILARATDDPATFRTECMCQRVQALDVLISPEAWANCRDDELSLAPFRHRVVACIEVAPDSGHATLVAAAKDGDGRVLLDVVKSWKDTKIMESELPAELAKIKALRLGWYPAGPAASMATFLRGQRGAVEIKGPLVTEACQEYVGMIQRGAIRHNMDPLLTAHTTGARKFEVSDGYRFVRKGVGHVDAAYAAAGAAKLALDMVIPDDDGVWVL